MAKIVFTTLLTSTEFADLFIFLFFMNDLFKDQIFFKKNHFKVIISFNASGHNKVWLLRNSSNLKKSLRHSYDDEGFYFKVKHINHQFSTKKCEKAQSFLEIFSLAQLVWNSNEELVKTPFILFLTNMLMFKQACVIKVMTDHQKLVRHIKKD